MVNGGSGNNALEDVVDVEWLEEADMLGSTFWFFLSFLAHSYLLLHFYSLLFPPSLYGVSPILFGVI